MIHHPSVARLVSAFRWRDGVYLVLEYAANGDLHSYIVANGALEPETALFTSGEVLAALLHLHDHGFLS